MNVFEQNLNLIKEHNSILYEALKKHAISPSVSFQLETAPSGDVNLIYNGLPLHCKNNPQQEAIKLFQNIKNKSSNNIVVLAGLGLGYLLKRLYLSSECKIVIFEPNINILRFTLEAVDFSQELQDKRIYVTNSIIELNEVLSEIYRYKDEISYLKQTYADALYPEEIKQLMIELPKINNNLSSNYFTLFKNAFWWTKYAFYKLKTNQTNSLFNILENKFTNKTALIVSAGPSLDKNLEIIKENREKFIIFCVNVAYKKLVSNGITPDFTLYIDLHDLLDTIKNFDHSKTNIISHIGCNHKVHEKLNPNSSFTFYCKNHLVSRWISQLTGISLENYQTKGSVSHLALLAATQMGCNPIILTGQDLAFPNGQVYSSGSFWGDFCKIDENKNVKDSGLTENKEIVNKKVKQLQDSSMFQVKGQNGEMLLTSPDYAGFIKHFEEFAEENTKNQLINSSTGGANINGFENKPLKELVDELETIDMDINSTINKIIEEEPDPIKQNREKILSEIDLFIEQAENYIPLADKGIKQAQDLYKELNKKPLNTNKIKTIISELLKLYTTYDENLFQKNEVFLSLGMEQIMDFNAIINSQSGKSDLTMFKDLSLIAKPLFDYIKANSARINISDLQETPMQKD